MSDTTHQESIKATDIILVIQDEAASYKLNLALLDTPGFQSLRADNAYEAAVFSEVLTIHTIVINTFQLHLDNTAFRALRQSFKHLKAIVICSVEFLSTWQTLFEHYGFANVSFQVPDKAKHPINNNVSSLGALVH